LVRSLVVQPISHYRRNHNNNWDELGPVNEATKIVTARLILESMEADMQYRLGDGRGRRAGE
jgi:hypothetical protein